MITILVLLTGMCIILTVVRLYSEKTGKELIFKLTRDVMMIIYLGGLIYFTFFYGGRSNIAKTDFSFMPVFWNSLTKWRYDYFTHSSLMNVMLFIPLGFLLPQFKEIKFTRELKWWQALLIAFAVTLLIESLQLALHRGAFQIDDLIRNTTGGIIGFMITRLTDRKSGSSL